MDDVRAVIMKSWIDEVREDPNLEVSEQGIAYIIYAAVHYGHTGEKINIGEVFGNEFKSLNMVMPGIYVQMNKIANYDPSNGGNVKYDAEAIKELRLQGFKAREICQKLGYPEDKANNLTTNKGWKEAGQILKEKKNSVQNNPESVQKENNVFSIKNPKNPDFVQNNTDMEDNTDSGQIVQKYAGGMEF